MSLDFRFDEDLMLISSFKAIVSNSCPLTVLGESAMHSHLTEPPLTEEAEARLLRKIV